MAGSTTVPPSSVTCASAASTSATSKYTFHPDGSAASAMIAAKAFSPSPSVV
jgi:hypothetical protein